MTRLAAYHSQTAPLVAYYDACGVLERVDATAPIETVAQNIARAVNRVTI